MTACALQLWLADTPSAHNNSYNVSNGKPSSNKVLSLLSIMLHAAATGSHAGMALVQASECMLIWSV